MDQCESCGNISTGGGSLPISLSSSFGLPAQSVCFVCIFSSDFYNAPRNFGLPTFQRQFGIFCGRDKIPGNDGMNGCPSTSSYPF